MGLLMLEHDNALHNSVKKQGMHGAGLLSSQPRKFVYATLLVWALFQLWYASPLPFIFNFFIINDTEARSMHLAVPLSLVILTLPFFKRHHSHNSNRPKGRRRKRVTFMNMVIGFICMFCAGYFFFFYDSLATRPGLPNNTDLVVACLGLVFLLEAARRVLGSMLVIVALLFMLYAFIGPYMPDVIAHKGASFTKAMNHYWLTTEGVFGIALGISNSLVFMFVLFGALLESAGGGNYFIRCAYALMGKFKGGPGKAAVAASALTGMISGSSTANVVTTGTFTIPLMRKMGFSAEKAGAVEVASSTNGQLMPPVMGAAAFLMAEYIGISYLDVIKHALLPAFISYLALAYIIHLEASKLGLQGMSKNITRSLTAKLMMLLAGFLIMIIVGFITYYGIGWIKVMAGDFAFIFIIALLLVAYVFLVRMSCSVPELPTDLNIVDIPPVFKTVPAGCYYILPIVVLMWCLIVERLSPSLSAFWASCFLLFIALTHWPLKGFFRQIKTADYSFKRGFYDACNGLVYGARNMIPIAIATATAGIIVGTVTLTGVGFVLTELIEIMSGGSLILVLVFTAIISLILGMGLPTTANYIVVSTLMAPVIVHLGTQNGLVVPLIAAHLFVFYFGILADDTPPVGLAAYAAAGISGGDPVKTGLQGFSYDIRTAILPFVFLFNTDLLLIDVHGLWHIALIVMASLIAMFAFCAAIQRYFITKNHHWETLALVLISVTLFRPDLFWDRYFPPVVEFPAQQLESIVNNTTSDTQIKVRVSGENFSSGLLYEKVLTLPLTGASDNSSRLFNSGLELRKENGALFIDNVEFDSQAQKAGFDFDQQILSIQTLSDRPSKYYMYIPALLLLLCVFYLQQRRSFALSHASPAFQ